MFGMRFGLERMRRLMTALGSPQLSFESVQVVGTNGKSSTARMTAALLEHHDIRAGAYLSPHVQTFAERVEIGGRAVSRGRFAAAVQRAAQAAELVDRGLEQGDRVTQFEALTSAAFCELRDAGVEAAVVEAGLGGRYDATSVIDPRVVAITNVGLEHTRWLGPTLRHVAEEKLAMLPQGAALVAGPLAGEALEVARRVVAERDARLVLLGRDLVLESVAAEESATFSVGTPLASYEDIALRALGSFQRENFAVAIAAAESFRGELDPDSVRSVAASLHLPGRMEQVSERPLVLLDGAHNPSAVEAVLPSLTRLVGRRRLVAVISILDDKDAAAMLGALLPLCARVVFTRSSHPRALPPATLESLARQLSGPQTELVAEPGAAVARARALAGPDGAVLVTGSIYLLADVARVRALGATEVA